MRKILVMRLRRRRRDRISISGDIVKVYVFRRFEVIGVD
jgi:hypothetical protein